MDDLKSKLVVYGASMSVRGIENLTFDQIKAITIANTRRRFG